MFTDLQADANHRSECRTWSSCHKQTNHLSRAGPLAWMQLGVIAWCACLQRLPNELANSSCNLLMIDGSSSPPDHLRPVQVCQQHTCGGGFHLRTAAFIAMPYIAASASASPKAALPNQCSCRGHRSTCTQHRTAAFDCGFCSSDEAKLESGCQHMLPLLLQTDPSPRADSTEQPH